MLMLIKIEKKLIFIFIKDKIEFNTHPRGTKKTRMRKSQKEKDEEKGRKRIKKVESRWNFKKQRSYSFLNFVVAYGALWLVAATPRHRNPPLSSSSSSGFTVSPQTLIDPSISPFPKPCSRGTLRNRRRPCSPAGPWRGFASSSSRRNWGSSFSATSTSTSSTFNSPKVPFSSPISLSTSTSSTPR